MGLDQLPQFTISSVAGGESDVVLSGFFTHLRGVREGRAWLYRPNDQSIEGDLILVGGGMLEASISVQREGLPGDFESGASFPYFFGYYEARVVDMILDSTVHWVRVKYEPTDSVQIVSDDGSLFGEVEAGASIPVGFRVVRQIPNGWSKESCEICHSSIGPEYQPFGYRNARDVGAGFNSVGPWLCERDYVEFAARHDLGFLLK